MCNIRLIGVEVVWMLGLLRVCECNCCCSLQAADEFDTTIPGPWMTKWEIVHVNRHVEALEDEEVHPAVITVG